MARVNYKDLSKTIASLCAGEDDMIALMASVVCELHHSDDRFDWTGFYRVTGPEMLKIIALALFKVAFDRSAFALKPFLADSTGTPLALIVPDGLQRADEPAFTVPATWSIYPPFLSL